MNIVYSSNDNYARHLAASMLSVIDNNKDEEKIDFYILNVGLSEKNMEKLTSIAESSGRNIYFVDFSDIRQRFDDNDIPVRSFSIETFARLFLAEALPETEERALWIDCDTITVGKIHDLYYCDMASNAAAAVIDQPNFGVRMLCEDAQIPCGEYFNAGIFLANLSVWREESLSKKFVEFFLKDKERPAFLDQAVINHVLNGRIYKLPLKYCVVTPTLFLSYKKMVSKWEKDFYSEKEFCDAKKNPVIIHYTNFRPWKKWCLHPLKKYYRRYIKMTPYKDIPLENDGFFNTFGKLFASVKAKLHL